MAVLLWVDDDNYLGGIDFGGDARGLLGPNDVVASS
jgi:hypothetical protein